MNHKEQKFISETCTEKAWKTLEIKNRMNLSKKKEYAYIKTLCLVGIS